MHVGYSIGVFNTLQDPFGALFGALMPESLLMLVPAKTLPPSEVTRKLTTLASDWMACAVNDAGNDWLRELSTDDPAGDSRRR